MANQGDHQRCDRQTDQDHALAHGGRNDQADADHRGSVEFLAEYQAALAGETGCRLVLPEGVDPFVFLFSESAGRVLVAVPRTEESRFRAMCEARALPATRIGVSDTGSNSLDVQGLFSVTLEELRSTSEGVLPRLFG